MTSRIFIRDLSGRVGGSGFGKRSLGFPVEAAASVTRPPVDNGRWMALTCGKGQPLIELYEVMERIGNAHTRDPDL